MRIAIGGDHAGFTLKETIKADLQKLGHLLIDVGALSYNGEDDYPDFAAAVAGAVIDGRAERAILLCGSGVGASIAANKVPGVRAALCHDTYSARQGVEHDDMNILVLGARIVGESLARELVTAFLSGKYSGEERHQRRLDKVLALERQHKV